MRKLETKKAIEKKQKKNQIILGSILIFLLVVSTAGYSIMNVNSESSSTIQENGINFFYQNGLWLIQTENSAFAFQNLPSKIKDITVDTNKTLNEYISSTIYFKNTPQGASEILSNINPFILRHQETCIEGETCTQDLPVKNCSDNIFIFVENSAETKVGQVQNCIYIYGDSVRGADAFLYKILGIA